MMQQIAVSPKALAAEIQKGPLHEVASDLAYQRLAIVSVTFIGAPDAADRGWMLVDAGLAGLAAAIRKAAETRFVPEVRPRAVVLTHGHFDHVAR